MNRNTSLHATENPQSYFQTLANRELLPKRLRMIEIAKKLGLDPFIPDAGYFLTTDASKIKARMPSLPGEDPTRPWDVQCKYLICGHDLKKISLSLDYKGVQTHSNSSLCILSKIIRKRHVHKVLFR